MTTREGFVDVPGGKVWYRIEGADAPGVPLVTLHGGPGSGHDYLEPLVALADERPVVLYDQLGCGKSEIPDDLSLWTATRFAEELGVLRDALGLEQVHLLGHSWGGWLALEYMAAKPAGVVGLVLSATSASAQAFAASASRLVDEMDAATQEVIRRCEAAEDFHNPEYVAATFAFYAKHLCRLPQPWPDFVMRTVANSMASPLYNYMWGPSEFTCNGTLATWDRSADLGGIQVPTLVISGQYDEAVDCQQELRDGIAGAELHIIPDASHLAHAEQPEEYVRTVRRVPPKGRSVRAYGGAPGRHPTPRSSAPSGSGAFRLTTPFLTAHREASARRMSGRRRCRIAHRRTHAYAHTSRTGHSPHRGAVLWQTSFASRTISAWYSPYTSASAGIASWNTLCHASYVPPGAASSPRTRAEHAPRVSVDHERRLTRGIQHDAVSSLRPNPVRSEQPRPQRLQRLTQQAVQMPVEPDR